ncbi:DedA family protein [Qipengyuania sediminis]|uniref:DedA family protein n=1 Tax=Qipengyuania sediminis TaxID=1532023 RepID=UPI00105A0944|nr:DedA family protein [Qipengyuania sediminis]
MHEFIVDAITKGGYLGIALLMAIENIFPPVPSEVIMGVGGIAVSRGEMEFWPLMIAGTMGSVAGNWVWFWLGRSWGKHRLQPFVERYGRWLTVEWEDVDKARRFFQRRGHWVVFFLRFSPFLRTMISLPAGLSRMSKVKFLVFTTAGVFIWNLLWVEGGRRLSLWLAESQDILGYIIMALVVAAVIAYIWRVVNWKPRAERD